jgi:two-component system, LuxR family, sensor kinase FixL
MRLKRLQAFPLSLVGALYIFAHVILDWVSFVHPFGAFGITPWNPSTGLSFALVLLLGRRTLPFLFAALTISNLLVRGAPVPISLAAAESLIVGIGYAVALLILLSPALRFDASLRSTRDLALLMAVAVTSSALVSTAYVAVLAAKGLLQSQDFMAAALRYWVGDMIGIAVVTPFGLLAMTRDRLLARSVETPLQFASIVLTLWVVVALAEHGQLQLFYLLFLPITWIAVRSGLEGVSAALVFIQLGLFLAVQLLEERSIDVADFQARMLVLAITGLVAGTLVTERHRSDARLRMNQEALANVSRLGSMGELATSIAHEINQPLSAAGTYTELVAESLQTETLQDRSLVDTARKAAAQISRASDVVRRLRTLVRLGRSDMAPTRVDLIVREAVELIRPDIDQRNILLKVDTEINIPLVMADKLQIEQALLNLMRNSIGAIVATRQGRGQITIRSTIEQPGFVEITVNDTGPGFAPALAADELPPTPATTKDGLGVGLSLCRTIARAHGGELRIRNTCPGASVGILLPTAEISQHG